MSCLCILYFVGCKLFLKLLQRTLLELRMQLIAHPIQVSLCYDMHNTRVHTACEGIRIADDHLIVTTGCIESIRGDISRNTREDSHGGSCNRTILPVFVRGDPSLLCEVVPFPL